MINGCIDDVIKNELCPISGASKEQSIEPTPYKRLSKESIPSKIISQIIKSIVNNNGCVTRSQIIRETSLCLPSQVDLVLRKLGLLKALYVCSNGRKLPVTNAGITLYDIIASVKENAPESMKEVFKGIAEKCEYDRVRARELIGIHGNTFQKYISKYYPEWKHDEIQYELNKFKKEFLETLKICGYNQIKTCKMLEIEPYLFNRFAKYCNVENWMELKREYKKKYKLPVAVIGNTVFIHTPDEKEDNLQEKSYITPRGIEKDRGIISRQAVWDKLIKDTQYTPSTPRVKRDIRITRGAYKQLYKRVR